ncbi:hypothetical protein JHK87_035469 [Glycine soja]|nr:hypothetical protein JHK87_035469 [Glycine soja]
MASLNAGKEGTRCADAATANLVGLFEGTNLCAIDDDREPKGGSGSINYLSAQHSDVGREVSYLHGTRTQHEDRGFTKITSTFRSDLWLSRSFGEVCTPSFDGELDHLRGSLQFVIFMALNMPFLALINMWISVTFIDKDGEEKHIKVPVGMSMLEAAHENDIELEGKSFDFIILLFPLKILVF